MNILEHRPGGPGPGASTGTGGAAGLGGTKTYSVTALGWMLLMAGFTMTVHLVLLTVARRIDPAAIHGYQYLFA